MTLSELQEVLEAIETRDGLTYAYHLVDKEIDRRKYGPLTLAEATASGKPFKRPGWNDYATELVDSDDDGYMCFVFVANGREPAYAEEILADDYELAEDNKQ